MARRQEELRQVTESHAAARHEAEAALEAERQHRQGLSVAKKREWQSHNVLTQLTQAPPPELTAATQADGDEAAQVEILQVCWFEGNWAGLFVRVAPRSVQQC